MSSCAFATSMPTKHGPALIVVRLPSGPTLHDAGSGGPGNCSGSWRTGRDDPRSPTASQDPGFKRPATSHWWTVRTSAAQNQDTRVGCGPGERLGDPRKHGVRLLQHLV